MTRDPSFRENGYMTNDVREVTEDIVYGRVMARELSDVSSADESSSATDQR